MALPVATCRFFFSLLASHGAQKRSVVALPFASLTRVLLIAVCFAVDAWGVSTPRLEPACNSALHFLCAALHVFEGANVGFLSSLYI